MARTRRDDLALKLPAWLERLADARLRRVCFEALAARLSAINVSVLASARARSLLVAGDRALERIADGQLKGRAAHATAAQALVWYTRAMDVLEAPQAGRASNPGFAEARRVAVVSDRLAALAGGKVQLVVGQDYLQRRRFEGEAEVEAAAARGRRAARARPSRAGTTSARRLPGRRPPRRR